MPTLICVSCGYEEKSGSEDTDTAKECPECHMQVLSVKTKTTSNWAAGEPTGETKKGKK